MKHLVKFSATLLAGLVLTACSGGGSKGGEAAKPTTPTNHTVNQPNNTKPTNPTNPTNSTSTSSVTGGVYISNGHDTESKHTYKNLSNADNLNIIVVDGKPVRVGLQDKGIYSGGWANVGSVKSCCGKYGYFRFGVLAGNDEKETSYLYYNGKPTKNMPAAGKYSYKGDFIITGETAQFEEEDYLRGKATFDVDFSNKKVEGILSGETLKPISINASIAGNGLKGQASSADFSTKADVKGHFFGPQANELGGVFSDGKNWRGAFGAAK